MKMKKREWLRFTMKISPIEGIFGLIPQRFGYDFMVAFVSKLFSLTDVGVFSSSTSLAVSFAPFFSAFLLRGRVSLRRYAEFITFMEGFLWLLLSAYLFLFKPSFFPFLAITILLYFVREASSPSWRAIISALTVFKDFDKWLAKRTTITTMFSALALLLAIGIFKYFGDSPKVFAFLFFLSGVARIISSYLTHLHYIPKFKPKPLKDILSLLPFYSFTFLFFFAFYISYPFITAYMMKEIGLSFFQYSILKLVVLVVSALSYPLWGHISLSKSSKALLVFSILGLSFYPFMYNFVKSFSDVLIAELYQAVFYSAFTYALAVFNMKVVKAMAVEARAISMLSSYAGIAFGSGLATALISLHALSNTYQELFLISTGMLFFVSFLLISPISPFKTRLKTLEEIEGELEKYTSRFLHSLTHRFF